MLNRITKRLFGHKLNWNNAEEIAEQLHRNFKSTDPLSIRFTRLHEMVTKLEDFADDPEKSSESKLEKIQMSWYDLWQDDSHSQ